MNRTWRTWLAVLAVCAIIGLIAGIVAAKMNEPPEYKGKSGQEQYCIDNGWKYDAKNNTCIRN